MTLALVRTPSMAFTAWLMWIAGPMCSAASEAEQCTVSNGCVKESSQQPLQQQQSPSGDADLTGLLQKKVHVSIVESGHGVERAPTPGGRTMTVQPGENYTCADACGMVGGVPVDVAEAASPDASGSCVCDIGPSPAAIPRAQTALLATTLFRQAPFLMTHDSGTGYQYDLDPMKIATQTQWLGLREQLECGARAFDMRVVAACGDFDQLHYHHSTNGWGFKSSETVAGTVPLMIKWSQAHPEELVVIHLGHCYKADGVVTLGPVAPRGWEKIDCHDDKMVGAFTKLGVKVETNCNTINAWTLAQASQFATMAQGGKILMIPELCVRSNWDSSVTNFDQVKPYVETTMANSGPTQGTPFMVQAFIQQGGLVVPNSARLNKDVYEWLTTSNLFDNVNFLETNLACAYTTSISTALGATVTSGDADRCILNCAKMCRRRGACKQ